ncbi:unnamed protein product, partial [Rotaria sordida]
DRQPIFSSLLTIDTFETYEKLSNNYLQTIHYIENELEKTIEQFQDIGLIRQYNNRLNDIKQQIIQIELNIKKSIDHLQKGLNEQNILQNKILLIIEDLNDCESQLTNRISMKEYQIQQTLQEVQIMLANIESIFDDIIIQSKTLEQEYSIAQQQTQIKDIQLRTQRVSRLIQETSQYLDIIHNKKQECEKLLDQLTNWLELKQSTYANLLDLPFENDSLSLESK